MPPKKTIVGLVDVNSSAHRIFQQWYSLTTKMGLKIRLDNFATKQVRFVLNLSQTLRPLSVTSSESFVAKSIFCFDAGCGGRENIFPEYKAQRPKDHPEGLDETFAVFKREISALGPRALSLPEPAVDTDAEADDMIATAAMQCRALGMPVVIISGDRDLLQLVDDKQRCAMYDALKKSMMDEAAVTKRMGVPPQQLLAYKVLVGDASDNIAGCPGVGSTRAIKLVEKYGTLENILKSGPSDAAFPKTIRENLAAFRSSASKVQDVMKLQHRTEFIPVIDRFIKS